ncbi:MAG: ExbD/TolR family protein, partial [Thiohalomonadales bacterium]
MEIENLIQPYNLPKTKPEISLAPLIDIIFLMLIFFMVTTVFPENKGLVIEKPNSEHASSLKTESKIVKLSKEGKISHKNTIISFRDLKRLMKYEFETNPALSIIIQADKGSTTEDLIKVIDICKS